MADARIAAISTSPDETDLRALAREALAREIEQGETALARALADDDAKAAARVRAGPAYR